MLDNPRPDVTVCFALPCMPAFVPYAERTLDRDLTVQSRPDGLEVSVRNAKDSLQPVVTLEWRGEDLWLRYDNPAEQGILVWSKSGVGLGRLTTHLGDLSWLPVSDR
jgi:hypothetical protein